MKPKPGDCCLFCSYGDVRCIRREEVTAEHVAQAQRGLARAQEAMLSGEYDIVVLDEINVAVWFGLLSVKDVLSLLGCRPVSSSASRNAVASRSASVSSTRPPGKLIWPAWSYRCEVRWVNMRVGPCG